nr:hypothetical protein BaRGS_031811 [Batillaria attramentaria]
MTSTSRTTWRSCLTVTANAGQDYVPGSHNQPEQGSRINRKKTELMKINTTANTPVTVGGEPIREVESFVYLGSVVDGQGRHRPRRHSQNRQGKGSNGHAEERLGIQSFQHKNQTSHLQLQREVSSALRMRNIGGQPKTMQQKIQTFLNTCLRRIFNIRWPEKIRNEELGSERGRNQWPSNPAEEVGLDGSHTS